MIECAATPSATGIAASVRMKSLPGVMVSTLLDACPTESSASRLNVKRSVPMCTKSSRNVTKRAIQWLMRLPAN